MEREWGWITEHVEDGALHSRSFAHLTRGTRIYDLGASSLVMLGGLENKTSRAIMIALVTVRYISRPGCLVCINSYLKECY